ncbi:MAG: type II toxin-antitoxin system VapC family toxin [Polyangiaceae bacterium]|nr:type II toxin-antitoxin system VapC family toxin [Polyangiaceae bacterium]
MLVLDASVIVELLLQTPLGEAVATELGRRVDTWHAPTLLDIEVLQTLGRLERSRAVPPRQIALAMERFREMPIGKHPHEPFFDRIWRLRPNLTAYDACYVALAEALRAPLLTADERLGQAILKAKARVPVVQIRAT